MVTKMSGNREMREVRLEMTDLPAFEGKKFGEELCPMCDTHLAVIGHGRCVLCMGEADVSQEDLMFDPLLGDTVNGLGDVEIW